MIQKQKNEEERKLGQEFRKAIEGLRQPTQIQKGKGPHYIKKIDKEWIPTVDSVLKELKMQVNDENREVVYELMRGKFPVNEDTVGIPPAEIRKAIYALEKPPYFFPSIHTTFSRNAGKEEKDRAYKNLELLVKLAPEKTSRLFDSMRKSEFYKADIERFLKTEYGKNFTKLLESRLKIENKTGGNEEQQT